MKMTLIRIPGSVAYAASLSAGESLSAGKRVSRGTSQELQTALFVAQANGEDDTIYLAAGIYWGNVHLCWRRRLRVWFSNRRRTAPRGSSCDARHVGFPAATAPQCVPCADVFKPAISTE